MPLPLTYTTGQAGHLADMAEIARQLAALPSTYVAKAAHTANSLLIADASGNIVDAVPAASGFVPSLEHNTSIGVPSIVAGAVVIDVTSKWGISGGAVYFDEDGATSGEEALMSFDATTGQLSWLLYSEVH